jgi:hypothetical protein
LLEAARGPRSDAPAAEARPRGNVVPFPARGSRPPGAPWRAREWTAIAASLVLGGLIGWQFTAGSVGDFGTDGGTVVARGELAKALDAQLASNQPADSPVRIGLTFRASDGAYCRSFVSGASSTAGLACRQDGQWRIAVTNAVDAGGEIRPAAALPPAVLQAIEARGGSEALDASAEQAARDAGWR